VTSREWTRRLVHIGVGAGAFLLPLVPWSAAMAVLVAAVLHNAFVLPRLSVGRRLLRADGGGRLGLVLYPLVLLVLVILCGERVEIVQGAWLAMAVGDGLAPIIGARLRRPVWPWRSDKSVTASLLAYALAGATMILVLPLCTAMAATLGGLVGEALPRPFNDNLTVPLLAAGAVYAMQG